MELPERLEAKIVRVVETGCWLWVGELNRNGYGIFTLPGGKRMVAHRAMWLIIGRMLRSAKTHVLDHTCRTRCCVNPHHMEEVTHAENTRRGIAVLFRRET